MAAKQSVAEELLKAIQMPNMRPMPSYISEADTVSVEDFMTSRYARNYVLDTSNVHWGGEINANHIFDVFADYHTSRDSNKVRMGMLEYVTVNSQRYAWDCYTLLCMSGLSLGDWRAKMAFWANPADTMALYALTDQYGLHTSVITKSKLWTTVTADYQGTEWDVLDISTIKLLYMGANRFGRIWKKAVADQPSFYGQNFNYQPMIPLSSVPSSIDVETACTLIQIGDSVPQAQDEAVTEFQSFTGPDVEMHDDAMDKIVNRLDVCQWHPLKVTDAMDKVINTDFEKGVQVETQSVPNSNPVIQVETKQCFVKLVRLDSILLDRITDVDDNKHETDVIDNTMTPPVIQSRLRPRKTRSRTTRHPRQASANVEYSEPVPVPPTKNKNMYVKKVNPDQSSPSEDRIKAQSRRSTPPTSNFPGLPIPESTHYDEDTDLEGAPTTDPDNTSIQDNDNNTVKKGTININSHTLKKNSNRCKYRCRMCSKTLNSPRELTIHHQATHNILYCSFCNKAFNNWLSLSRHEYEHQHRSLKCPKCDSTFTFESQLKAHQFAHRKKPSFFCVYPKCGKAFFFETDLTRHAKRHNEKWYQCLDCPYRDTDKRNFDSHRLSHSRIAKYKCESCGKEFIYNTQKLRHNKDGKCPIKRSNSPTY